MKTITKRVFLLVFAAVMCLSFAACKGNSSGEGSNDIIGKEGDSVAPIVGKWEGNSELFEFTENGEFSITDLEDSDYEYKGTYEISGKDLVLSYEDDKDEDYTFKVESDKLTLEYNGEKTGNLITEVYTKVK